MNANIYNMSHATKFVAENFWGKIDKTLPLSEIKKLYEQFISENENEVTVSVNEMLNSKPFGEPINEDAWSDYQKAMSEFEDDIPDDETENDDDDDEKEYNTTDDIEKSQVKKQNSTSKRNTTVAPQQSKRVINTDKNGSAYIKGDYDDINYASDLTYNMLINGEYPGLTTQDAILPYSLFDVTDVRDFTAVFAFKDLPNVDLSDWNVSKGTIFEGMFYKSTFNNDSIKDWELKRATNIVNMFCACDFDKQYIIDGWEDTINPQLGYLPIIGQSASDDAEVGKKHFQVIFGNPDEMKQKLQQNKQYRLQAAMKQEESNNKYVMSTSQFINERYGVNEGKIGDFAKKAFNKIKESLKSVGIKLKDGFIMLFDKTMDLFGANLPQNIVTSLKENPINGVYAEYGKGVNYPDKQGYYEEMKDGSQEYSNFIKFLEVFKPKGTRRSLKESVEVNERRVGLHATDDIDDQEYYNIDLDDWNTEELTEHIRTCLDDVVKYGASQENPFIVWGAPGIGKTTIPKTIIKEVNAEIEKNGGDEGDKMSIIVIDCSSLQAGDLSMPMPVKIDENNIAEAANNPVIQRWMKATGITKTSELVKIVSAKSSDAPKTWLPMFIPTGDDETDKVRNDVANGHVNAIYDENKNLIKTEVRGGGGIIIFDEFLRCDPDTLFGIAQIMMERETASGYKLGSKWFCMGCSNRPTDDLKVEENFERMPAALSDRTCACNFVPKFQEWRKWAKDKGGFDDFTLQYLQFDADGPKSRWHNIDPEALRDRKGVRKCTPRNWTNCIAALNRECKRQGVKTYDQLKGTNIFRRIVGMYLPANIADDYVSAYLDNVNGAFFDLDYDDVIKNPTMQVDATAVVCTNTLRKEIENRYSIRKPIPPYELEKIIQFLENNYSDQADGGRVVNLIAGIYAYCDLMNTNSKPEYTKILIDFGKNHPKDNMQVLISSQPKSRQNKK